MNAQQAKSILEKYRNGSCTPDEKQLVERWYHELESTGEAAFTSEEKLQLHDRMAAWLQNNIDKTAMVKPISASRKRNYWWAAAAIFVLLSAGAYWLLNQTPMQEKAPVAKVNAESILAPDNVMATVTLSDGTVIPLDSLTNKTIAEKNGVNMVRLPSGELVYANEQPNNNNTLVMNTLRNPKGSRVATLVLADGSKVWLNAGSSITYPIMFSDRQRKVTMTGEGYFEVAKDASRPFSVSTGETEVAVLGTHFNVNAYGDDAGAKVTLVEGSVSVQHHEESVKIKPGQQAVVNDEIIVKSRIDTEKVLAWKNGLFHFESATIQQVMQEIGRWYDMEVKIEAVNSRRRFGGEISRSSTLGQVLTILQESKVQFTIQEKTIIVKSVQ